MKFLELEKETFTWKQFILVFFLLYLLALGARLAWLNNIENAGFFDWGKEHTISNIDGYYYADGARSILAGEEITYVDGRSPMNSSLSKLTAYLTWILPIELETALFYMPVFIGSLMVLPLMLIGRALGSVKFGVISAIVAVISMGYVQRTKLGWFDTDMLNYTIPIFTSYFIIAGMIKRNYSNMIAAAISMLVYEWWYHQAYSLNMALAGFFLLYTLIFDRKSGYNYKLFSLMLLPLLQIPFLYKVLLLILLSAGFVSLKARINKYLPFIIAALAVVFFVTGGYKPTWSMIQRLFIRASVSPQKEGFNLNFLEVFGTVSEVQKMSFNHLKLAISGSGYIFWISLAGYLLLLFRYRVMIVTFPILLLGLSSIMTGKRFSIYAVPVCAMGFTYLLLVLTNILNRKYFIKYKWGSYLKFSVIFIFLATAQYPNILHAVNYRFPPRITRDEINVLSKLGNISEKKDYAVSWWDYGYPIMYFSKVNVIGNGGNNDGDVNFGPSYIFLKDQKSAAKMARIDVEFTEEVRQSDDKLSSVAKAMKHYGYNDSNEYLKDLEHNRLELPKKTRDIYLYLPYRIIKRRIFPSIMKFSSIDLMTGERKPLPFFYQARIYKIEPDAILLGPGFKVDLKSGTMYRGNKERQLNSIITIAYNKDFEIREKIKTYDTSSRLYLLYLKSYKEIFILDEKVLNSLYFQLFAFENYDRDLFELIEANPFAKVYKLKI